MRLTGERIRLRRLTLNLSQEDLADAIDSSQRQKSKYERGLNTPSGDVIMRCAIALDTTTDYLLGLSDVADRPADLYDDLDGLEREIIRLLRARPLNERLKVREILKVL